MNCPICGKRPAKRFCPAKGEKICAVCCGREREVTIDCVPDCPHLITAHRYESEHRKPVPSEQLPYPDLKVPVEFVYEHWPLVSGVATTTLNFQLQNRDLGDGAVLSAIEALAEAYRTLGSGIYYERPPDAPMARALYGEINQFLQEFRKEEAGRAGMSRLKDTEVSHLLVFLLRVGKQETNGRPRSRAFLDFLRARFPLPAEATKDASRIIMP
ncbi:MAG: hypothetical protein WA581_05725 [Candidatus Acidiferrales bacterium]